MTEATTSPVQAAGGLVSARDPAGRTVIAVIHRPRYDDWSLPKGHLERGEDHLAAALREVREETGLDCVVGPELPTVRYVDGKGRPKHVRYWLMEARGGSFQPGEEVDELRWLTPEQALAALSYEPDRELVRSARTRW